VNNFDFELFYWANQKVQFNCSATKSQTHEITQNINIQLNKFREDFVVLSFCGNIRLFSRPQLLKVPAKI
jgi:hypothetical protein